MKRAFVLCIIAALCAAAFGQIKKGPETEILKNRFDGGAYFNYEFDTAELPVSTTAFTIPYIRYELETAQGENNKFYLDGDLSYNFSKTVVDGEAPDGADQFGTVLNLQLDPRFRFYVTEEMLKNMGGGEEETVEDNTWNDWEDADEPITKGDGKWFFQVGLPVTYQNITPQNDSLDAVTSTFVDADIRIGFYNKKVDLVKKTPWGKFEKGWMIYGLFDYRLVETYYDEDSETMPIALGAAGDYAYELDSWIADATVKGFLTFKYQMADEAMLVIPKTAEAPSGWEYFGKSMNLRYGFEYAQDFTDFLNVNLTMAYNTIQLLDDPEDDSQNFLEMYGRANFYLPAIPELNIWGGIDWTGHLPEKLDYTPDFNFTIGAEYRFDVTEFKKKLSEKKAEEVEKEEDYDYEW